jgi:hypothetical protein
MCEVAGDVLPVLIAAAVTRYFSEFHSAESKLPELYGSKSLVSISENDVSSRIGSSGMVSE